MRPRVLFGLCGLLVIACLTGLAAGQVDLFPPTGDNWPIFRDFRLPRVLFAAVNGAMLALAGMLYQIVLRNPMADGFTTGAASSAAFGGCLALVLIGYGPAVPLAALMCAALGMALVRGIAGRTGDGSHMTMILAGIALSVCASSGISVRRQREILFVITTVLVALSVSFCGVIGFLGLMIPHACRALFGHNISAQLASAPLLGAVALVVFDALSRTLLPHGGELPVGIMTSASGGLFFILLLLRKGNKAWSG